MKQKMTERQLGAVLSEAIHDAVVYSGEYLDKNERALQYYMAEPFGDEIEGRSKVVKTDVADVVDADMVSLTRVFLGTKNICKFQSHNDSEEAKQEALDKTKYINHLVRNRADSFLLNYNWLKGAEVHDYSVLKYYAEEKKEAVEKRYNNVDDESIAAIAVELGDDYSIKETTEADEDGFYDVVFTAVKKKNEIAICHVPLESFLINRNAESIETAELVGDRDQKTRGELLAEGYDRALVSKLPKVETETRRQGTLKQIRFQDEGGEDIDNLADWASEVVDIENIFVKVDYDGDGIAERRNVIISGNHVLYNEPYDHVPYAALTAYPMMHKAIGQSRAEKVMKTQEINSVLLRQGLDNLYQVNNPKTFISDDVDVDDLLSESIGGYIATEGDPRLAAAPLTVQPIFDGALTAIQYMDQLRANTTGGLQASQGLSETQVANETATRFNGIEAASAGKVELLARIYAETGYRKLYEGLAWTAQNYQDDDLELMIANQTIKTNPSKWVGSPSVVVESGLGMGDKDQSNQVLTSIMQVHRELKQMGSPLVDSEKVFNLLEDICQANDIPATTRYFNNPEQPESLIVAENEMLRGKVQQLQQLVEQSQNPLKEAEEIKAQAKLLEAQARLQNDQNESNRKRELDIAKMLQDDKVERDRIALKLTEFEMKYGTDSKQVFDANQ